MEAKNFRIGNIVYYHGTNGPRNNINKLDAEDIKLMSEDSKYLALHEEIELNEKLLIRLGFTKNGVLYENGKFAIKEWKVGHQQQWQVFWGDGHLGQYNDMKLHELQNLFFALNKTELHLKPEYSTCG